MTRRDLMTEMWAHIPDVSAVIGLDGSVLWAAGATDRLLGLEPEAMTVMTILEWVSPDDAGRVTEVLRSAIHASRPLATEVRLRSRHGGWTQAELAVSPGVHRLGPAGEQGLVVSLREFDHTRRVAGVTTAMLRGRAMAECLADIAQLVEGTLDRCGCAIYVVEHGTDFVDLAATSGLLTWVVPDLRSSRELIDLGPVGQAVVDGQVVIAQTGPNWGHDQVTATAEGLGADCCVALPFGQVEGAKLAAGCIVLVGPSTQLATLEQAAVDRWGDGATLVVNHHQKVQAARRISQTDTLSGLPNYSAVLSVMAMHREQSKTDIGVVVFALDGLSDWRVDAGYAAAMAALREVAEQIRLVLPAEGFIGRLDGDDLVVVVPLRSAGDLVGLASRLALRAAGADLRGPAITIRVGAVPATPDDDAATVLQKAASLALGSTPIPVSCGIKADAGSVWDADAASQSASKFGIFRGSRGTAALLNS